MRHKKDFLIYSTSILLILTGLFCLIPSYIDNKETKTPLEEDTLEPLIDKNNMNTSRNEDKNQGSQDQISSKTLKIPQFNTFSSFSIDYPISWAINTEKDNAVSMHYSISDDPYKLLIDQVQGDGEECILEGSYDPMMEDFIIDLRQHDYRTVHSDLGQIYYFLDNTLNGINNYKICIPSIKHENKLFYFHELGIFKFETPQNPEEDKLKELEDIISSIRIEE